MKVEFGQIYEVVRRIPYGRVATYGQVARLAGYPRHARLVGYALAGLKDEEVPWHRVVNAAGKSSLPPGAQGADRQRARLAEEGVLLGSGGRAVLKRYRWK